MNTAEKYILKLTVNDHPGVMSHVCGLFARRGYNLEGVMVRPINENQPNKSRRDKRSLMWLLLNEDDKSEQVMRQTEKLIDVLSIERRPLKGSVFEKTDHFFR